MRTVLESPHWPAPKFRYSPLVAAGPFLKTAGMIGLDVETGMLVSGGVAVQARRILSNLRSVMDDFRLEIGHMVSATLYVVDFDRFGEVNAAWDEFFPLDAPPPARTSVGVTALPLGAAVEMDFLFYVTPTERENVTPAHNAVVGKKTGGCLS